MNGLPPELEPRRDAIHDRVVKKGLAGRRRRRVTAAMVGALVLAVPIAAFGAVASHDDGKRQVQTITPATTEAPSTTTTVSSSTTSTTAPATGTSVVPTTRGESPTTTIAAVTVPTEATVTCRNSTDPACGPFFYNPPLTNAPATLTVTGIEPKAPHLGDHVTFRLHVTDPDSFISAHWCGYVNWGDGQQSGCGASCASLGPQYGAWDPPPARPSNEELSIAHTYLKEGTFTAKFTVTPDECGPRPSEVSASITFDIGPFIPRQP